MAIRSPVRGTRRRVSADPHPTFADAVAVSRFWSLVDIRADDECWPWLGDEDGQGYGIFSFRGRRAGAHQYALSFTTGEEKLPGLDTCHSCDNPPCCNPYHLRFDTRLSNVEDMISRGRANRARKLTDEDVVMIRERRANGARQKDLAAQYNVSDGAISMIVRGVRYENVGGPIETERKYIRGE